MKKVPIEHYTWIIEETDKLENNSSHWKGNFVSHCVPKRYTHYCKILHPMYRDKRIIDERLLWRETADDEEIDIGDRLRYRELASKYNVKYTKEISTATFVRACYGSLPRYLISSDEGNMEIELVKHIVDELKPFMNNKKCFFYYYLLKTNDWSGDDVLFHGELEDVISLYNHDGLRGSPTYWWAEDKSWCLCTDYDLDFSLFGGSKEIVKRLVSSEHIECIEVDLQTRIDYKADENNLPTTRQQ